MIDNKSVFIAIPVLNVGGTEMQTLNLASVLLKAGYKITVCCYHEYDSSMVSQMETAGARVILMKLQRSDGVWRLNKKLRALFKEIHPDIVHIQYIAPGLVPIIAAKFSGIRTIFATVHQPGRIYGWKPKLLIRTASYLCTAFFCNSKSVEESWFGNSELFSSNEMNSSRKHFTIYNGVDVDNIDKITRSADRKRIKESLDIGNKKVIGAVGRLRSEKGQSISLHAMVDVIKVLPDTVLLVVGDGPDRRHLEQTAKRLGIDRHVIWLGQKDQNEVFQLYSIMDTVAVPSVFEGFGLSAAEAMAAGCPVVGTRVDGLAETIEEDVTGYAVPVNDSRELAAALIRLLSNPAKAKAMGLRGYERVRKMFSIGRFAESTIAAYRHFIEG